jgi:hypothetical protein
MVGSPSAAGGSYVATPERRGFSARGKAAALRISRLPALARQISEAR